MTFKPVILKLEKNDYFDWLGTLWFKGLFDGRHYFKIEKIGERKIKLIHGEYFSGTFSKIILNMIQKDTVDRFIKMNLALKQLPENKVLEPRKS